MNIVYSSSDSYSEICGISLLSLLENNKAVSEMRVFIIDNGISDANREKLEEVASSYGRKIVFCPRIDLEKIVGTSIYVGRWNIGTFFRLYLGSILPKDVERVMYFDCDMIIRHDLTDVYNLDLGCCSVAGVDDCRSDLYRVNCGSLPGEVYMNNGFMLIDLKKWREEQVEGLFNAYLAKYQGDVTYVDQGVLNGVLGPRHEIHELPAIYNAQRIFFDFSYKRLLKLRKPEYHLSEDEYNHALSDPTIVHFTPTFLSGTRPWQVKDKHPFTPEYLKYKGMSPWKDVPLRKDDRKLPKKIMTVICKMTPRPLLIKVMSYLHATWYPKKRIKIMEKKAAESVKAS